MSNKVYFEIFCKNLRKARLSKNISASELSGRVGKDRSYIGKIERQRVNVSLKAMIDIADCLEISLLSLLKD